MVGYTEKLLLMKNAYPILFLFLILPSLVQTQDFKVIGYLPYYRFVFLDRIDFDKITHLNIAFANPDMDGMLDVGEQDITPVVAKARRHDLTVMLSLAGGALKPEWEAAWEFHMLPANRSAFIHQIVSYVKRHDLDGIDFDLEWQHVDEQYSGFVLELRDSLKQYGYLLTAALPGTYRYPPVSDAALAAFDWINLMAYDLRGPWDPYNPGQHSPVFFAEASINYWIEQGVRPEKLSLGVPFYGYDFSQVPVKAFTYRSMVEMDPAYALVDQVGQAYYNGIPTIQAKTEMALEQVGGLMIWELGQDSFDEWSLLNAIDQVIRGTTPAPAIAETPRIEVFPNPFAERLILNNEAAEGYELTITDTRGRTMRRGRLRPYSTLEITTNNWPDGVYFLHVHDETGRLSRSLVKP